MSSSTLIGEIMIMNMIPVFILVRVLEIQRVRGREGLQVVVSRLSTFAGSTAATRTSDKMEPSSAVMCSDWVEGLRSGLAVASWRLLAGVFRLSENYQYTVLESLPVRSVVAKIKAADADIGSNAEMDYRIMDSDGPGFFNVTTDEDTQDGVITLLKVGDDTKDRSNHTGGLRRFRDDPAKRSITVPPAPISVS